ncbi:MAG: trypsin-like peptidase domain-containing protein [Planctomycetota bacterium]
MVRIQARSLRESGWRVGTGFLWRDRRTVVTCLHLVSGARMVDVMVRSSKGEHAKTPCEVVVLPEADLALLILAEDAPHEPIQRRRFQLDPTETLLALGFPRAQELLDSTRLHTRDFGGGEQPLHMLLNERDEELLRACRWPDLDGRVLNLEGSLLAGHSGAPIFDRENRLVGIANGGVVDGTVARSWAIPMSQLRRLERLRLDPECVHGLEFLAGWRESRCSAHFAFDVRRQGEEEVVVEENKTVEQIQNGMSESLTAAWTGPFWELIQAGEEQLLAGECRAALKCFKKARKEGAGSALEGVAYARMGDAERLRSYGEIKGALGAYDNAIKYYGKAVQIGAGIRDWHGLMVEAWALYELANLHLLSAKYYRKYLELGKGSSHHHKQRLRHHTDEAQRYSGLLKRRFPRERNVEGEVLLDRLERKLDDSGLLR